MGNWLDKTGITYLKGLLSTKFATKIDKPSGVVAGKFLQTDSNGDAVWGDAASSAAIVSATENWLANNVSGGSTIAVDTSLTVSGAAADAKVTGNVKDIFAKSNGLDVITSWADGYAYKVGDGLTITPGSPVSNSSLTCACIPCQQGDVFTLYLAYASSAANYRPWCFINSSGTQLKKADSGGELSGVIIKAPETAAYLIVNTGKAYPHVVYKGEYVVSQVNVANHKIEEIRTAIGTYEKDVTSNFETGYYWDDTTDTAVKSTVSTYRAYDPIIVSPGEKYKVYGGDANSANQHMILIVDENYAILERYGIRSSTNLEYTFEIPDGGQYILLTTKSNWQVTCWKIALIDSSDSYDFRGKNVAIIGDSISTNGVWSADNLLGNVPEIIIEAADIGKQLSAYITFYDIGTTVGGHEIVASDVGTELTFTPIAADEGKIIGKPKNNNDASVVTWWEVAAKRLDFNPIPVCWSGASITSHEENTNDNGYIYKCAHAWHPSQIRKCGIRTPGTMTRTAPDVVIIYRGTNDLTHSSFSRITDYMDSYPNAYPENDTSTYGGNTVYDYAKGLRLTIKKLRDAYPNVKIVLCTLNYFLRLYTDAPYTYNSTGDNWMKYNAMIRRVAQYEGCDLIEFDKDGLTWSNANDGYYQDAVNKWTHPTTKGHKVLGNRAIRDMMMINSMT